MDILRSFFVLEIDEKKSHEVLWSSLKAPKRTKGHQKAPKGTTKGATKSTTKGTTRRHHQKAPPIGTTKRHHQKAPQKATKGTKRHHKRHQKAPQKSPNMIDRVHIFYLIFSLPNVCFNAQWSQKKTVDVTSMGLHSHWKLFETMAFLFNYILKRSRGCGGCIVPRLYFWQSTLLRLEWMLFWIKFISQKNLHVNLIWKKKRLSDYISAVSLIVCSKFYPWTAFIHYSFVKAKFLPANMRLAVSDDFVTGFEKNWKLIKQARIQIDFAVRSSIDFGWIQREKHKFQNRCNLFWLLSKSEMITLYAVTADWR